MTIREKQEMEIENRFDKGLHFREVIQHRNGCSMCRHSQGIHPQAFELKNGTVFCDSIGRYRSRVRGGQEWHTFVCKDVYCKAKVLVRADALSRFVTNRWF